VLAVLLVVEGLLVRRWLSLPVGLAAVAMAPVAIATGLASAAAGLRVLSCLTMHYVLDARTLTIVRGTARWVVPLTAIERVYIGEARAVLVDRLVIPGFNLGRGYVKDRGKAVFFTTLPAAAAVAVQTETCTYLVSPRLAGEFVGAIEQRRGSAGAAEECEPGAGFLVVLKRPLAAGLALLAALGNLALYAYIVWWLPALPDLPVHFSSAGMADRWGPAAARLWLPQIGTIILVSNLLLAVLPPLRRPMTTYVLLAAALLVQVFLWLGFLMLLP